MSMPPCLMKLDIENENCHFNLWLPLFIVWLILFLLALALAPIVLFLALVFYPLDWGKFLWRMGPAFYNCLCALKGLSVDVRGNEKVQVYFK